MTRTIVGYPRVTENCNDISTFFGPIKYTVLPPRGLFHPVLLYGTQAKLLFPLCKNCQMHATKPFILIPKAYDLNPWKKLPNPTTVWSMALPSTVERTIQGLHRHLSQNQTRSERLPKGPLRKSRDNDISMSTIKGKKFAWIKARSSIILCCVLWQTLRSIRWPKPSRFRNLKWSSIPWRRTRLTCLMRTW